MTPFQRKGPLKEVASYPAWVQAMVSDTAEAERAVVDHPLWEAMCHTTLPREGMRTFMTGVWPVIERFPAYMALNLLKTRYGRSDGETRARRWLVRNIRVEQNHADYWLDWAEAGGVARDAVLNDTIPTDTQALADWCETVSRDDTLAAGMIATNYAVEGATGRWSQRVYDSKAYADSLPAELRKRGLRWLHLHADYDDTHPWEALEIVCALVGEHPSETLSRHLTTCVRKSYEAMGATLDACLHASATEGEPTAEIA